VLARVMTHLPWALFGQVAAKVLDVEYHRITPPASNSILQSCHFEPGGGGADEASESSSESEVLDDEPEELDVLDSEEALFSSSPSFCWT